MDKLIYVPSEDTIRMRLNVIHAFGVSWRNMAKLPEYKTIPAGTLCAIAKGKRVPDKHKKQLGLPYSLLTTVCSAGCGEVHSIDRACEMQVTVRPKPVPRARKQPERWPENKHGWLWDISKNKLLKMLENRS